MYRIYIDNNYDECMTVDQVLTFARRNSHDLQGRLNKVQEQRSDGRWYDIFTWFGSIPMSELERRLERSYEAEFDMWNPDPREINRYDDLF